MSSERTGGLFSARARERMKGSETKRDTNENQSGLQGKEEERAEKWQEINTFSSTSFPV